eukprot:11239954-Prorocentrum_lima.AAC.1
MVGTGALGPVCGDGEVDLGFPLPFSSSPLVDRVGMEGRLDKRPCHTDPLPAFTELSLLLNQHFPPHLL